MTYPPHRTLVCEVCLPLFKVWRYEMERYGDSEYIRDKWTRLVNEQLTRVSAIGDVHIVKCRDLAHPYLIINATDGHVMDRHRNMSRAMAACQREAKRRQGKLVCRRA